MGDGRTITMVMMMMMVTNDERTKRTIQARERESDFFYDIYLL